MPFTPGPLSLTTITGESSVADYQDHKNFGEAIVCSASEAAKYGFTVVDRPEGVLVLAVASLGEKVVEVITPMFMLPATLASSMFTAIRDRVNCRLVLHFVQRKNRRVSPTKTHVFSTKTREVL